MATGQPASAASASTTSTPTGPALNGASDFQIATPQQVDSNGTPTGGGPPAPPPSGTNMNSLPSWLSTFISGGQATAPASGATGAPAATTSVKRNGFVPGTSLSGYGMARPMQTYLPPPKATVINGKDGEIPALPTGDQGNPFYVGPDAAKLTALTPQQQQMVDWVNWVNKKNASGGTVGGGNGGGDGHGGESGANGNGGLW